MDTKMIATIGVGAVVGVSAVGYGIYRLVSKKELEGGSVPGKVSTVIKNADGGYSVHTAPDPKNPNAKVVIYGNVVNVGDSDEGGYVFDIGRRDKGISVRTDAEGNTIIR